MSHICNTGLIWVKMINWRLFTHKFFNNLKMLLSSSWAIFIRVLMFSFSLSVNFFFVEILVLFLSTSFSIHSHLVQKSLNRKNDYIIIKIEKFQLCFDTTNINLFRYKKPQSRYFLIQLETTMQWVGKFKRKIMRDEKF